MKADRCRDFHLLWFILLIPTLAHATTRYATPTGSGSSCTSASPCALQTALNAAVAGDEVVLRDGIYTGQFTISGNAGTAAAPITLKAENKHKAIFENSHSCANSAEAKGLTVSRSYWVIKDLRFRKQQRAVQIYVSNVTFTNNIVEDFDENGIDVRGVTGVTIDSNVIGNGSACVPNRQDAGIFMVSNADGNTIKNNIIYATGNNGYQAGGTHNGAGAIIGNNSDNNQVLGNLFLANQGKEVFGILGGYSDISGDNNIVRGNAFLWGEGGVSSRDCKDSHNHYINNLHQGNYYALMGNKGDYQNQNGNFFYNHNLYILDKFTRQGWESNSSGDGTHSECGGIKDDATIKNNIFYGNVPLAGRHSEFRLLFISDYLNGCLFCDYNLFWGNDSNVANWHKGYTFGPNDIRNFSTPPVFVDAQNGDFTLAAGSPGKNAGDDGKDMGITYDNELKKAWVQRAYRLPTAEQTGLGTSVTFTTHADGSPISGNHYYQMWFHIPVNSPCGLTNETFNIDGVNLARNVKTLWDSNNDGIADSVWISTSDSARWITLGRHKTSSASDTTLSISWTNASCADGFFIRKIPTPDEAFTWISGASANVPTLSFSASPQTVASGQPSTLSWSSTNATSCIASGAWSGAKPLSGSETVSPLATSTYTLTCSGTGGSATQAVTVTVMSSVPAIPGRIQAEDYNAGGAGVAYHDTTPGNLGGVYRSDDVDIKPDGQGGYSVGFIDPGEWLKYDVSVSATGTYEFAVRVARGTTGTSSLHLEVDGVNVSGPITIPSTGSWSMETTVTIRGISLTQGAHTLRLFMDGGLFDLNWLEFVRGDALAPAPPKNLGARS